ncbi:MULTISPECIES: GNAT family N-acetyltransferase [Pseudomonadota]|jgi:GNAT superfamily N-acetyltransferase|uniref:GNAT family N-acetyltransferase n=2 Tax=Pseudomonadota TaxID=1224 RepID=UPI0008261627|nr:MULTISPECIES: GNAT family N-acetyltransferase [Pseudomonadota]|tara:strand:- start:5040 stop:5516 length:477 start_codon:yes stop_codon:yes gene_type:complete
MARGADGSDITLFEGASVRGQQAMLAELCARIFDSFDPDYLARRLPLLADPVLHVAHGDGHARLGFKLGYRRGPSLLYSWLGGVVPEARGLGIAARLMQAQHDWAAAQGYHWVETRTRASNNRMIIVNLKAGFHIAGVESDEAGHLVVIQRRRLNSLP